MRIRIQPATATELRVHARTILERARWQGQIFRVTIHETPAVVVMSAELFDEWARAMGVTFTVVQSEFGSNPVSAETAEPQ
jgi:prevent-host-death family protein